MHTWSRTPSPIRCSTPGIGSKALSAVIRAELPQDIPAIREVNKSAFGGTQEVNIVDALRRSCPDLISLVAILEERVVGHILFSPVVIESSNGAVPGMGLGPLAVLLDFQNRGIGAQLVRAGLGLVQGTSCPFVIVLGHPDYYPRFGFERASAHGVQSQWSQVPDEAFLLLVLDKPAMQGVSGTAFYRQEFEGSA